VALTSWFFATPESVVLAAETLEARRLARQERSRFNGPRWRQHNEHALAASNDTNHAGGQSDRGWILDYGPWDVTPDWDALNSFGGSSHVPPRRKAGVLSPAARTAEGKALTRARQRYLAALAANASCLDDLGQGDAPQLVRRMSRDPRNTWKRDTEQDLVRVIRTYLGYRKATWEIAMNAPPPLLVQNFIGASCGLNLYLP
jgi:hypothetical protein